MSTADKVSKAMSRSLEHTCKSSRAEFPFLILATEERQVESKVVIRSYNSYRSHYSTFCALTDQHDDVIWILMQIFSDLDSKLLNTVSR